MNVPTCLLTHSDGHLCGESIREMITEYQGVDTNRSSHIFSALTDRSWRALDLQRFLPPPFQPLNVGKDGMRLVVSGHQPSLTTNSECQLEYVFYTEYSLGNIKPDV
jgi:hypothetical protein